ERKQLFALAARWYGEAFAAQADLADSRKRAHRFVAASLAALAAAGKGKDAAKLNDKDRSHLRQQALAWLQAELQALTKHLEGGMAQAATYVRQALQRWQSETALDPLRGAALANLPAAEQAAWRKLWADADALHKRAASASSNP